MNRPRASLVRGLQLREEAAAKEFAELSPLITFYLETHANSTARQVATGIGRSLRDVENALSSMVRMKSLDIAYRIRPKRNVG